MSDTAAKVLDAETLTKLRDSLHATKDEETRTGMVAQFQCKPDLVEALLATLDAANDRGGRMADHLKQWNRLVGELGSPALAASTNCLLVEAGRKEVFVEQRFRDGYDERNRKAERTEKAEAELAELRKELAEARSPVSRGKEW